MMGIFSSYNASACALVYIGLSHTSARCRAISVARPGTTRLLSGQFSYYYGSSRWIEPRFVCHKRARWERDVFSFQRAKFSCDESASKWKFISSAIEHDNSISSPNQDNTTNNFIKNILVCGDGDLSYCAEIAQELKSLDIELYATVLEAEAVHNNGKHYCIRPPVY